MVWTLSYVFDGASSKGKRPWDLKGIMVWTLNLHGVLHGLSGQCCLNCT